MSPKQREFIFRWLNITAGTVVASRLVHGIHYLNWVDLFIAAFLLGLLNVFVRPVMMFLSIPFLVLTLGLFTFVINGLLLYFVGSIMSPYFEVTHFGAAFWGAVVITIVAFFLNLLTGTGTTKVRVSRASQRPPPPSGPPDGDGPVIDV